MRTLTLICAAAIAVCGTVWAQSQGDRISVHFATPVSIGDSMLPAGDCDIQVLRGVSDTVLLELRSAGAQTVLVPVSRIYDSEVATNGHATVILGHRHDKYQLEQIVLADRTGYQIPE